MTGDVTAVAVVSDTHLPRGTRRLPAECLRILGEADLILHGGDFVAEPVLDELSTLAPVEAVHGNMDDSALRARLPAQRIVEVRGVRIGMTHVPGPSAGRHERLARRFPGCAAVVYGHTHEPEVTRYGDVWMLNPGSPTERRRALTHSLLSLRVGEGSLEAELVELS